MSHHLMEKALTPETLTYCPFFAVLNSASGYRPMKPMIALLPQHEFHMNNAATIPNRTITTIRSMGLCTAPRINPPAMKPMTNSKIIAHKIESFLGAPEEFSGPDEMGPEVIRPVAALAAALGLIGPECEAFPANDPDLDGALLIGPDFLDLEPSTGISNIFPSSPDFLISPPV
nr:hypothetical protein Iba_chr01cCG11550 [Ipomoea batatas]GMC53914.1 hypothetical protein Iba_chr01dCG11160 [Ipomoea batatas]